MSEGTQDQKAAFKRACAHLVREALGVKSGQRVEHQIWNPAIKVAEVSIRAMGTMWTSSDVSRLINELLDAIEAKYVPREHHQELLDAVLDFHGTKDFRTDSAKVRRIKAAARKVSYTNRTMHTIANDMLNGFLEMR